MEGEEETNSGSPPPHAPLPPPSQQPPLLCYPQAKENPSTKGKASTSSQRQPQDLVSMERNRREKMSEFYAILQSIVPNMFPKATRARVIDETVTYIRYLEDTIIHMEREKSRLQVQGNEETPATATYRAGSVEMTVHGKAAFFGLRTRARPGLVSQILQVFERRDAVVLNASVKSVDGTSNMAVTAELKERDTLERLKEDLLALLS